MLETIASETQQRIPPDIVSISDYERYAKTLLPTDILEYIDGGVADDITLKSNRQGFDNIHLYNRIFGDFNCASTNTILAGMELTSPILLAPVAHQRLVHDDGELATARAAATSHTPMICSTLSNHSIRDITRYHNQCWFQLYWQAELKANEQLIAEAERTGCRAIVITLDAPVNGLRNRAQRAGFKLPNDLVESNLVNIPYAKPRVLHKEDSVIFQGFMRDRPNKENLEWLRKRTSLPLFAKGVSHPDDALALQEIGFDGLIISTHGGRTLDTLPASINLLPSIRQAVGDDYPVLLDSGIRRGTDIIKALALGANAVCIGRPQLWSLAVGGALGVAHMLRLLQQELEVSMALCGCPTIADISSEVISSMPLTINRNC